MGPKPAPSVAPIVVKRTKVHDDFLRIDESSGAVTLNVEEDNNVPHAQKALSRILKNCDLEL